MNQEKKKPAALGSTAGRKQQHQVTTPDAGSIVAPHQDGGKLALVIDGIPIRRDSAGRYSLNDLHKAAMACGKATEGHAPGQFLRNDGAQRFIAAFDARRTDVQNSTSVDAKKIASVHSVKGGKNQGTYAAELVAIRYAAWIDADFEVGVYLTFQALHLKKKRHQDLFELVKRYEVKLRTLGVLLFQTGKPEPGSGGRPERFALLNEDQAFFVLTLSRNTPTVVDLKLKLIQAFGEARRAAQMRGAEYLPTYHALHDQIHALTAGSPNERFVHMNVNKLVNQTAGIKAGQRASATVPQQSMLTIAQAVAAQAMKRAPNHRAGFQQVKTALVELSRVAMIEGSAA